MALALLVLVALGLLVRAAVKRWRRSGDELPVVLAGAEAAGIITSEQRERILAHAATTAGFASDLQLRRAWSRQWGGSPRDAARAARSTRSRASR